MGESAVEKVARLLAAGTPASDIRDVPGTCWKTHDAGIADDASRFVRIPSFETVKTDKKFFAEAFKIFYREQNFASGKSVVQDQGAWFVVQNPPAAPLSQKALDKIYSLPYARRPHPVYDGHKIPAFEEVRFSITSHRGCFGECAFCAITLHQGRVIQSRSVENILEETRTLARDPDFKGYVHDVGGPTANFRIPSCGKSLSSGACQNRSCLWPSVCPKMRPDHSEYMALLQAVASVIGVKKVFVRSGLRIDYIMAALDGARFLEELCKNHVSGQLKIAPEHADPNVLKRMRKHGPEVTEKFIKSFREINARLGRKQFLVPYFMSSHPGCGLNEAKNLARFMSRERLWPEQTQEFTPTPGTLSTCVYHTGIDPFTGGNVYVPKSPEERKRQKDMLKKRTNTGQQSL
jgi:uncharacterized radical SAM protein YgiQ